MAYDALSSTTRKTRIRLLNSCAAYIVVQTFQIDVEANGLFKIPEGSPDGILSMLTLGLMCFLFISFLIYGYDDWRSIEPKGPLRHANSIKENFLLEIRRAMGKTQGRDVKHVWRDKYKLNQDANKIHEELLAQTKAGVEKVDNLLERNQIFDLLLVENRKDIYEAYKDYSINHAIMAIVIGKVG
ncbi:MAG: hypothetical protein R8N23_04230 [Reichenbachiella sp.]|uniref:hypothetical protein n=1 Tax=Reichenbachiella sp. TaxID=2184521 RepID=UPI002966C9B5|nr:hypothetical protein [Reichenbachiella sp.]MDW3209048.1 hypothetical protein [Reichenbachiella sp.]